MRIYLRVLLGIWVILGLVGPSRAESLIFGVVAASDVKATFLKFRPVAQALSQTLGKKVQLEPLPWAKFEAGFRSGRFHLALASPGFFLLKGPYRAELVLRDPHIPVAVFRKSSLSANYQGRKVAVWPYAYEGYLAQASFFSTKFGRFEPAKVKFLGSEALVVLAVLNGKADLGWVSRRAAQRYGPTLKMVNIPGESKWLLFLKKDLPALTSSKIKATLLRFRRGDVSFEPLENPPELPRLKVFLP